MSQSPSGPLIGATRVTTAALSPTHARGDSTRAIAWWLLACAAMVFAMAVIGAITRLTGSGLSMVEWRPLIGALPPLNEGEWQRVFDLYRATPEYQKINAGMGLDAFKQIFFWEWFHRLWGRSIGLVFALPFFWFWLTGRIDRALLPRLLGLLLLGGAQGLLGWFMVKSGLVDRPSVSHYRLAAHLGLAVLIYGLLVWQAWTLLTTAAPVAAASLGRHCRIALALAAITMLWGAFVAGLDAGLAYNSFPLMDGRLLPPEAWSLIPAWTNPFDNTALVQFIHRWLAIATGLVVVALWVRARLATAALRNAAGIAAAIVLAQVTLGIATLLLEVPVALGAAHQAGALILLTALQWCVFRTRRPAATSNTDGGRA